MKTGEYYYTDLNRAKDHYHDSDAWKMKQRRRLLLGLGLFWFCVYQCFSYGGLL